MRKIDQKYPVKCEDCGIEYLVGYKTFKKSSSHLCKKCNGMRRVEDLKKGNIKYFSNPDNVKNHSTICKKIWEDRPEEFKKDRINNLKIIGEKYRDSVDFSSIISTRAKEYYKNPENRKNLSEKQKAHWNKLSKDERKIAMLHLIKYWDNINDEELDKWYKSHLDGMIESDALLKGPTENIFCNDLDNIPLLTKKVKYKWQYRSQIKHPDFDKLFPFNKVTGGKFVNPYHIWDFIIYSESGNILIDIDGSIHNTGPGIVKYSNEENIEFSDLIKFNDSQRPYQTDGLEAYIIRSYNNKLEDNTEVLVLKDNSIISYKTLLSIIMISQISKSEIKELKKCI